LRPSHPVCRIAALDIPSRRHLVDRIAAATERRLLRWEAVKRLARLAAVRGVIFASRQWLADFLGVSLRTLARIIDDLKHARVFVVLAARGAGGGTVLVPAWGCEVDEPAAARAILAQLGQAVDEPGRGGTFKAAGAALRRLVQDVLPEGAVGILRRVARRMCHERLIEPDPPPTSTPASTDAGQERAAAPPPAPSGRPVDDAGGLAGGAAPTRQPPGPPEPSAVTGEGRQEHAGPRSITGILAQLREQLSGMMQRPPPSPPPPGRDDLLASARRLGIARRSAPAVGNCSPSSSPGADTCGVSRRSATVGTCRPSCRHDRRHVPWPTTTRG
jgi:hypothetical protein